jgi:RNA polymerase sigma-32 factor
MDFKPNPEELQDTRSRRPAFSFNPLQQYLTQIRSSKLISREMEKELATRFHTHGDAEAAKRLVCANLKLVVKIAMEYHRIGRQNILDLIQEGNIGLIHAVKKFDPTRNVKFSYYASFWIKAYILKYILTNWRLVKIGTTQGQRKIFFKLNQEKDNLIRQGFEPRPSLLAERLGVSEHEIVEMEQRLQARDVSLDAPLTQDSDMERIQFLGSGDETVEDRVAKKEMEMLLHAKIAKFRKSMTPRELDIFDLRIFSETPVVLQELADRYGISKERVRQVEKNIYKKIKVFLQHEIPDIDTFTQQVSMN